MKFQKVGGLYHWRVGRVGGSFYLAKRKPVTEKVTWFDPIDATLGMFLLACVVGVVA